MTVCTISWAIEAALSLWSALATRAEVRSIAPEVTGSARLLGRPLDDVRAVRPRLAGGRSIAANAELPGMHTTVRGMPDLELALLRRGVDDRTAGSERCGRCRRSPLISERIYDYGGQMVLCELCRWRRRDEPT